MTMIVSTEEIGHRHRKNELYLGLKATKLVSRQEKRLAAADEMPTAAHMIPLWPQKPVARGCVWKYVEGLIGTKSKNFSV